MRNTLKFVGLFLALSLVLCGCKKAPEKAIEGTWYTEQNGVRLTVSFAEDGVMTTLCTITDKAAADRAGVNSDVVSSKNISCYYKVDSNPQFYNLTETEQKFLAGKNALVSYFTQEEMENGLSGETIYFTVLGDTLTTTQLSGAVNAQTNEPVYSETVFKRVK